MIDISINISIFIWIWSSTYMELKEDRTNTFHQQGIADLSLSLPIQTKKINVNFTLLCNYVCMNRHIHVCTNETRPLLRNQPYAVANLNFGLFYFSYSYIAILSSESQIAFYSPLSLGHQTVHISPPFQSERCFVSNYCLVNFFGWDPTQVYERS